MAYRTPLTPEQRDEIRARVHAVFARLIGLVALVIGAVAAGLTAWAAYRVALLEHPAGAAYALVAGFLVLAGFFLYVGWRLALYRPNRHGSIFGPAAWRVLGALFTVTGAGLFAAFARAPGEMTLDMLGAIAMPVAACGFFAYLCFRSASRAAAMPPDARL